MHGFKYEFSKISWEGVSSCSPSLFPRPLICSISGFALNSRASVRGLPPIHPSNMFINPSPNRGGLDQTLFPPISISRLCHWTQYIVPRLRSWFKYTTDKILDGRLGELSENPAWWMVDERVITEHRILGIIAPDASILVQNHWRLRLRLRPPGEAYSALPDPLAFLGWDRELVTTLMGVNYVPPCLWPVPPCCF